jgi:uncharacterized protein YdaU (DUF1376 family)
MGKRPDTWMPFYIGDYLRDTSRLTTEGHGAYMLMIFDYWAAGKPLPDDDSQLAAVTRLSIQKWRVLKPTLAHFFLIGDGIWRHKRIDEELARATDRIDKRSAAGSAGAATRWGKVDGNRIANASESHSDRIADANAPSESPSEKQEDLKKVVVSLSPRAAARPSPAQTPEAKAARKEAWQQAMMAYVNQKFPPDKAAELIGGYLEGEEWAVRQFDVLDAERRKRKARA